MENKNTFQLLDHETDRANSVVSFPQGQTIKIGIFLKKFNLLFQNLALLQLSEKLSEEGFSKLPIFRNASNWNESGVKAEILDPKSGGWKKGKIRMRVVLEFCPDESEEIAIDDSENNSLDDIRKTIS